MTRRVRLILVSAVLAAGVGCAHRAASLPVQPVARGATTRPVSPNADLALDEIRPAPILSATRPSATTQPAPLDALDLYAQAREAMLDNRRFTAIALLEKAIAIDSSSFELYYSL